MYITFLFFYNNKKKIQGFEFQIIIIFKTPTIYIV